MLSAADLGSVSRANAHFSDDLLSSLLNEPIRGQGVFWSSVGGKPHPVPIRVLSFEEMHPPLDPEYCRPEANTHARHLRGQFQRPNAREDGDTPQVPTAPAGDILVQYEEQALAALRGHAEFMERLRADGVPWRLLIEFFEEGLPVTLVDRNRLARRLVPTTLARLFGPENHGWETFREQRGDPKETLLVRVVKQTEVGDA